MYHSLIMENSELIVELGIEEIPASMVEPAAKQFSQLLSQYLSAERLPCKLSAVWYTPRRMIAGFAGIPVKQGDLSETVMGPPKSVSYDVQGAPTKAATAFAQKNGLPLAKIKLVHTPKGEYLAAERTLKGKSTRKILEEIIPAAISKIQFPKTMYWTADKFRFVRPLRWILAVYQGRAIRFQVADVRSGGHTSGHRFLGHARIQANSLAALKEGLQQNGVLADPEERRFRIREGLLREAAAAGGNLIEDPELFESVVNLNEYPSVICGSFEEQFLLLPAEILVTVMRTHQKYFSVMSPEGKLLPVFLAVVNLERDNYDLIRTGHERVLRARLADAAFFWNSDRKAVLLDREPLLKSVLFQEKLGSYFDKTMRILKLLPLFAGQAGFADLLPGLELAARMSKCDLVTEMVKEFPDLQGVVGGLYTKAEGASEEIWRAIYEQYLPKSTGSSSPSSPSGAVLALLDRLDTVCGCFSIGLIPSGSKDPLAVRRQGNGIIKILLDHRLRASLAQLVHWSLETLSAVSSETAGALREFFEGRLRFLFEEEGYSYDCINAALAVGFDDPLDARERVKALQEMREHPDFLSVASNFKRVVNILAQAGEVAAEPDEAAMTAPAETLLWNAYLEVRSKVEAARQSHDYATALRLLASMRQVVDEFFEKVLVMADDPAIKQNRLALLLQLSKLFLSVADISQIVLERPKG